MSRTFKQSVKATLSGYAGVGLGMINKVVLFPLAFAGGEAELWGLLELFISYGIVVGSIGHLGRPRIVQRFLPIMEGEEERELLHYSWRGILIGVFITVLLLLGLDDQIASLTDSPLAFKDHYLVFCSIAVSMLIFEWGASLLIARFQTHIPMLFNQLVLRLVVVGLLLLKWQGIISAAGFLHWMGVGYLVVMGSLLFLGLRVARPSAWTFRNWSINKNREKFAWVSLLAGMSSWGFAQLDNMVVGALMPLSNVAFLVVAKNVGNVVHLPGRSIMQALTPMVSQFMGRNDRASLKSVYEKSISSEMFVGIVVFSLIWLNVDWILSPIQTHASVPENLNQIVILVALGKLVDLSTGVSGVVINNSTFYRMNVGINLTAGMVNVILLLWMVPKFGLMGAAAGQLIGMVVINILRVGVVRVKLQIWPYRRIHLYNVTYLATFLVAFSFRWIDVLWADLLFKHLAFALGLGLYFFLVVPSQDLKDLVIKKWKGWRK